MRGVVITELGRPPEPAELPEPEAADGRVLLDVLAAPLNPLDVAVAAGRYHGGHPAPPYVPGCEAVARLRRSGEVVWAFGDGLGLARDGAMAGVAVAAPDALVPVPPGADPALAGALGIAGLAGWLPLARRVPVRSGDRVLVLGATGTVGLVAVQTAVLLGAGRVVAAGRDDAGLERARGAGADEAVRLDEPELAAALRDACGDAGPTLVFDPLWGAPAAAALAAAAPGARVVHLGQSAGPEATLSSGVVRGKQLDLHGFSVFAVPRDVLALEYRRLVEHAVAGRIAVDVERLPLEDAADAWRRQAAGPGAKLVLVP